MKCLFTESVKLLYAKVPFHPLKKQYKSRSSFLDYVLPFKIRLNFKRKIGWSVFGIQLDSDQSILLLFAYCYSNKYTLELLFLILQKNDKPSHNTFLVSIIQGNFPMEYYRYSFHFESCFKIYCFFSAFSQRHSFDSPIFGYYRWLYDMDTSWLAQLFHLVHLIQLVHLVALRNEVIRIVATLSTVPLYVLNLRDLRVNIVHVILSLFVIHRIFYDLRCNLGFRNLKSIRRYP